MNEFFKPYINEGEILAIVSKAHEFQQVKVCLFFNDSFSLKVGYLNNFSIEHLHGVSK